MDSLEVIIDQQIKFNQGKNIFLDNLDMFQFSNDTIKAISNINGLAHDRKQMLIDYTIDKVIEELCRINQYYSFDSKTKTKLRVLYTDLLNHVLTKPDSIGAISKLHYRNLRQCLLESNPFAERVFRKADKQVNPISCSQYSPGLQIKILNIDMTNLVQPVLDIGCGKESHLVNFLYSHGFDIKGIDRFQFTSSHLITADWLEYEYGNKRWGTIISNLSFSNHFRHHHLRPDGNYIGYGRTYMRILNSLKIGGSFHYAPDLPFVEQYLDSKQFSITKHDLDNQEYKATIIKQL